MDVNAQNRHSYNYEAMFSLKWGDVGLNLFNWWKKKKKTFYLISFPKNIIPPKTKYHCGIHSFVHQRISTQKYISCLCVHFHQKYIFKKTVTSELCQTALWLYPGGKSACQIYRCRASQGLSVSLTSPATAINQLQHNKNMITRL